jgi:hypothetical protein
MTPVSHPHSVNGKLIISRFKGTSLIEGLWGEIKSMIKSIYNTLPGDLSCFKAFMYEAMWRRKLAKLKDSPRLRFLIETYRFTF